MAKLKLPMYEEINAMSPKDVKKELKRLKPIALKRIKNIINAGKTSYIDGISNKLISDDISDDYIELQQISMFLRKPFSKLSNIKKFEKDMVKSLKEKGYDFINDKNIGLFNEFMGEVKAMYGGRRIPASIQVANLFAEITDPTDKELNAMAQGVRLRMSKKALLENLGYWVEHMDELRKLKSSKAKTKYSANYIKSRINKIK